MKATDLPTCHAEGCDKAAFVQDLGKFTDPPGTERWWCEDHALEGSLRPVSGAEPDSGGAPKP